MPRGGPKTRRGGDNSGRLRFSIASDGHPGSSCRYFAVDFVEKTGLESQESDWEGNDVVALSQMCPIACSLQEIESVMHRMGRGTQGTGLSNNMCAPSIWQ